MAANIFGQHFQVMSFGESHGVALGVVIDGCPAGVDFDLNLLEANMKKRRPGSSSLVSARNEADRVEVLSGIYEGKTLGTPIALLVKNQDQRSQDYNELKTSSRPGHADDVWRKKFSHVDHRGGGRSSGRETLSRVLAGSVAQMFIKKVVPSYDCFSFIRSVADIGVLESTDIEVVKKNRLSFEQQSVALPGREQADQVATLLEQAKMQGKSYGGVIEVWLDQLPVGLGQPVFRKFKSDLTQALMSIGAVNGVEFGQGFLATRAEGSEFHNPKTENGPYGGVRGGLTTGERIELSLSIKPTSSVLDIAKKGRHDPCIVLRARPVVESMIHLVVADHLLWQRLDRI